MSSTTSVLRGDGISISNAAGGLWAHKSPAAKAVKKQAKAEKMAAKALAKEEKGATKEEYLAQQPEEVAEKAATKAYWKEKGQECKEHWKAYANETAANWTAKGQAYKAMHANVTVGALVQ